MNEEHFDWLTNTRKSQKRRRIETEAWKFAVAMRSCYRLDLLAHNNEYDVSVFLHHLLSSNKMCHTACYRHLLHFNHFIQFEMLMQQSSIHAWYLMLLLQDRDDDGDVFAFSLVTKNAHSVLTALGFHTYAFTNILKHGMQWIIRRHSNFSHRIVHIRWTKIPLSSNLALRAKKKCRKFVDSRPRIHNKIC